MAGTGPTDACVEPPARPLTAPADQGCVTVGPPTRTRRKSAAEHGDLAAELAATEQEIAATAARVAAHWRHVGTLTVGGHDVSRAKPLLAMRWRPPTHLQQHRARLQRELDQDIAAAPAGTAEGSTGGRLAAP